MGVFDVRTVLLEYPFLPSRTWLPVTVLRSLLTGRDFSIVFVRATEHSTSDYLFTGSVHSFARQTIRTGKLHLRIVSKTLVVPSSSYSKGSTSFRVVSIFHGRLTSLGPVGFFATR